MKKVEQIKIKKGMKVDELVREMVQEDLKHAKRNSLVKQNGYAVFDYHE